MAAYEASDFLWAKAKNITPTEKGVNLRFKHKMSSVRVRLVQGDGWADEVEFAAVKKEILVSNTIRKSTIDLATGEVTPTGDVPLDGVIPVKDGDAFRAIVVPQSVALQRAMERDGASREAIAQRMAVQMSAEQLVSKVDYTIENITLESAKAQVESIDRRIRDEISSFPYCADNGYR
jgi:hypothetical protein